MLNPTRFVKAAAYFVERIALSILLLGPAVGMFYPPESYFSPQDFSLTATPLTITVPYSRYINTVMIAWLAFWAYNRQRQVPRAMFRIWPVLLFILWMLFTTSYSSDPAGAFNKAVRTLCLAIFASALVDLYSTRVITRYLSICGITLMLASTVAVVILPSYALTTLVGYEGAWRGATIHKNTLGPAAAVLIIQLFFLYRWRIMGLSPMLICVSFSAFVIVKSQSSTSLVMLLFGVFLCICLISVTKLKGALPRIVTVLLLFCVASALILSPIAGVLFELTGREATLTGRTDIWSLIWELIQRRPFTGYGSNFWAADSALRTEIWIRLNWATPHAHNTLLDLTFQTGFIGLSCFLLCSFIFLARAVILIMGQRGDDEILWPIIASMFIFRGITETQFVEPGSSAWFLFTLGFASLSKNLAPKKTATSLALRSRAVSDLSESGGIPKALEI